MAKLPPVHIVAPTCVRYTFKHTIGSNRPADMVVDISIDGSGSVVRDDVIDDFNSHVCGYWQDAMVPDLSQYSHFIGAQWIDLDSLTGRTGSLGPAAGHPSTGGQSGNMSPPNVCRLIHKYSTAHRGERQGRMYVPDVLENNVDGGGVLSGGEVTGATARLEAFRSAVGTYTYPGLPAFHPAAMRIVHVHKPDKADPSTWTWSSSTVDSVRCDPVAATQRRRLR